MSSPPKDRLGGETDHCALDIELVYHVGVTAFVVGNLTC